MTRLELTGGKAVCKREVEESEARTTVRRLQSWFGAIAARRQEGLLARASPTCAEAQTHVHVFQRSVDMRCYPTSHNANKKCLGVRALDFRRSASSMSKVSSQCSCTPPRTDTTRHAGSTNTVSHPKV